MNALTFSISAVALMVAAALPAFAQSPSLLDTSRALREEMRAAAQIEDFETARRLNAAALSIQPGHSALLNNAVLLAGFAGDAQGQFEALEALAGAGLSYDLDGAVRNLAELEAADPQRVAALRAAFDANAAPVGEARLVASPPLGDALIEALAVDNETERLYLGGVAERRIYRVEPFAPTDFEVFAGEDEPIGSIFGLAADRRNGRLYAVEGVAPQTPLGDGEAPGTALLAFDLETGELIERYTIEGAVRMGDLTVRDGVVFVSDADAGRIYRLNGPRAELELYAEDDRFASLQGLAQARGALWVVDYALGLWRIDPVTRHAHLQPSPDSASLIGLDGLVADRLGRLFVVRNGAGPVGVFELMFDAQSQFVGMEPVLTGDDRIGEPTTLRVSDGRLFVNADAPWDQFPEDGTRPEGPRRTPQILAVPIP
ncbi:hypothetical protein ACFELO_12670 [Oceanicaulis sp. LC35]|uniref:hypothetical protein n=1 Tax=Oceanicaulis sp. LC35 TaxID=3349635 RepID=UPI003F839846